MFHPVSARRPCRRGIVEVLGEQGFGIEFTEQVVGNRSPMASELMETH